MYVDEIKPRRLNEIFKSGRKQAMRAQKNNFLFPLQNFPAEKYSALPKR